MILSCSVIFFGASITGPFFPASGFFFAAAAKTFFGFLSPPNDMDILGAGAASAGDSDAGGAGGGASSAGDSLVGAL